VQKENLVAVRRVLALAGYERTYDPAQADLIWSWKTPFWWGGGRGVVVVQGRNYKM
jgi:hypothetical protein